MSYDSLGQFDFIINNRALNSVIIPRQVITPLESQFPHL